MNYTRILFFCISEAVSRKVSKLVCRDFLSIRKVIKMGFFSPENFQIHQRYDNCIFLAFFFDFLNSCSWNSFANSLEF